MVQPRKEQVKNLKTKYTKFVQTGTLVLSGGPTQTILNTGLESQYDNLIAATKTLEIGGAETSAPAILYGGNGPYSISIGAQISVFIPGINNNQAMIVAFATSDFVTLNSSSVLTTWRTAVKINTVLATYGITTPVAANVNGQLILTAANASGIVYGDEASITLTDITPGTLTALGFGSGNNFNAIGTTAPRRGLITASQDGLGGFVQLRSLDATALENRNNTAYQVGGRNYVPQYLPGQPSFARLQAFPGAVLNGRNFRVTYQRKGPKRPSIVTSTGSNKSNFSTISIGDQITISMDMGGDLGINPTFITTYSSAPTTLTQVINAINSQWQSYSLINYGIEATRASIKVAFSGPYRFTDPATRDSFFISFNGNAAIHINPTAGVYTAATFTTYINNQIGLASQTAQGEAVSVTFPDGNTGLVIQSKNLDATISSVQVYPGNPGGIIPGDFMETIDYLGLSPGVYRGSNIVTAYGNDEIQFICPSALDGSEITVSFSSALISAKFGLSTTQSSFSSTDIDTISIPQSIALLPEMMEFSEEYDDYDTRVLDYILPGTFKIINPVDGLINASFSPILDLFGKISPAFIPQLVKFLGIDQLSLGQNLIGSALDQLSPRIQTRQNTANGPVLIWEGSTTLGSSGAIVRLYNDSGAVKITYNASYQGGVSPWVRDTASLNSTILDIRDGKIVSAHRKIADSSPWADTAWRQNLQFNVTGAAVSGFVGTEGVQVGKDFATSATDAIIPRYRSPLFSGSATLILETQVDSGIGVRLYSVAGTTDGSSSLFLTINTKITGNFSSVSPSVFTYNKDVNNISSVMVYFGQDSFQILRQLAANNTAWSSWNQTLFNYNFSTNSASFGNTVTIASNLTISAGNVSVSGNYLYSPVKSQTIVAPPSWYIPHFSNSGESGWGGAFNGLSYSGSYWRSIPSISDFFTSKRIWCYPRFSSGTVITRIKALVQPNNVGDDIWLTVYKVIYTSSVPVPVPIASTFSVGVGTQELDSGAISETINNSYGALSNYLYFGFFTVNSTNEDYIFSSRIEFTDIGLSNG